MERGTLIKTARLDNRADRMLERQRGRKRILENSQLARRHRFRTVKFASV